MNSDDFPEGFKIVYNNIQPWLQCNDNNGYCGEVSLLTAGLYFGQYISEYDIREIGAPYNEPPPKPGQEQLGGCQLLLGTKNFAPAAKGLRFDVEACDSDDSETFLAWVKTHVARGHPVIIGVFNNEDMLYGKSGGDPEYDHIVPVCGFASAHADSFGSPTEPAKYHPNDIIIFSDNGLYTQPGTPPGYDTTDKLQGYSRPFQYSFTLVTKTNTYDFLLGRHDANKSEGNIYSLLNLPKYAGPLEDPTKQKKNHGMAILGLADTNGDTRPVRILTNPNHEKAIGRRTTEKPQGTSMRLSITVSGLAPGVEYNMYQYDNYSKVPTERFNANSKDAVRTVIKGQAPDYTTWTDVMEIESDQQVFFRVVATTAG